jgi:hypothetical protein
MKSIEVNLNDPSFWQVVFLHSKVNGANYNGEALPRRSWDWPKDTYLQRRLRRHKERGVLSGWPKLPKSSVPIESVSWLAAGQGRDHKLLETAVPFHP